ncbi:hypothetical protein TNCV_276621 [Trichonephila clavipes]|nr:hypothetical protein TNCV_276621 [Trichonephila clavipes]
MQTKESGWMAVEDSQCLGVTGLRHSPQSHIIKSVMLGLAFVDFSVCDVACRLLAVTMESSRRVFFLLLYQQRNNSSDWLEWAGKGFRTSQLRLRLQC